MDDGERPRTGGRSGPEAPRPVPPAALNGIPLSLVLTNPALEDNPIIYVNAAFTELTGYPAAAALGRNCRFLQGPQTEPERAAELRAAIAQRREAAVEITNHRADGTPFVNRVVVVPVTDGDDVVYFLGTHSLCDPDDPATRLSAMQVQLIEVQHRVKNHLAMIVGLIRLQARRATAQDDFTMLARRVEALQLLYHELSQTGVASTGGDSVPLGAYVSRIAAAIAHLDGGQGIRISVSAEEVRVDATTAGQIGLLLSELLTNAFRHGFSGRDTGEVETRLERTAGGVRLVVRDDGVGMAADHGWPDGGNLGSQIVRSLLQGLRARHALHSGPDGTTITLDIPSPTT